MKVYWNKWELECHTKFCLMEKQTTVTGRIFNRNQLLHVQWFPDSSPNATPSSHWDIIFLGALYTLVSCFWGFLLPPANEVWGKVMFWHLCVSLFTGGLCLQGGVCRGVCIQRQSASREGLHPEGVCLQGGSASRGLLGRPPPPPHSNTAGYGQREVGTHPTGMQSCLEIVPVLCVSMVIKAIELTMGMDPSSALTGGVFQNDLFSQNNHPCITLKNETL